MLLAIFLLLIRLLQYDIIVVQRQYKRLPWSSPLSGKVCTTVAGHCSGYGIPGRVAVACVDPGTLWPEKYSLLVCACMLP